MEFFDQQLQKTRADLADVARQITDYKENFQGELPEQLLLNRDRLERNRMDLASTEAKLEAARDQVRLLTMQIQEMRTPGRPDQSDPSLRMRVLELELNKLLSTGKTEKHPDIVHAARRDGAARDLIASREDEPMAASREEMAMRDKLRDYEVDGKVLAGEVERLKADIAEYEQRIENTPRRAAELDHLDQQYKNLNEAIRTLQLKQVEAEIGKTIETNNKGERFRVVESAEIPTSPISPNRPVWFIAGTLLGMMLGLGAARAARDERPQLPQRDGRAELARAAGARGRARGDAGGARGVRRFRVPRFGAARV